MYRIRLPNGEERAIEGLDALADAVRDGTVTATCDIWHQRAEQWLPILRHPHFQLASSRVGAEPARSTVGRTPAAPAAPAGTPALDDTLALLDLLPDPEPSAERAAARPAPASLEAPATTATAPAAAPVPPAPAPPAAPAPAQARRRSRELEFVYVPESAARTRAAGPRSEAPAAGRADADELDDAPVPADPAAGLPLLDVAFDEEPVVEAASVAEPPAAPAPQAVVAPAPVAAAPAAPVPVAPAPVVPARAEPVRSSGSFGAFQVEDDDYDDWTPPPADPALAAVLSNRSTREIDLGPIDEPLRARRALLLGGTTLAVAGLAFFGWHLSRPADASASHAAAPPPVETTILGSNTAAEDEMEEMRVVQASAPAVPARPAPAVRAATPAPTPTPAAAPAPALRDGFGGTDRNPGFVPRAAAAAQSVDSVRVVAPEGLGVPAIEPVALPASVAPDRARDAARQAVLRSIAERAGASE